MKNMVKILSIIMGVIFVITAFCSCGSKTNNNETVESTETVQEDVSTTENKNSEETEVEIEITTEIDEKEEPTSETTSNTEMTVEQIVELYNNSVNKVKKEAKSITRNYQHLKSDEKYFEMPSSIQSIAKSAINTFVKGSDEQVTWTSKEDFKIGFPVSKEDYSSHLKPKMVKSATCKDNEKTYEIDIVLYDDAITSPKKGEGYAGVFNTVAAESITSANVPGVTFEKIDVNGIDGHIKCTIDKETNHVTHIEFVNTDVLDMQAKVVVSTLNAKFALASELNFDIKY